MLELARGLGREGAKVSVACPEASALAKHASAEAIPVVRMEKRGRVDIVAARTLGSLLLKGEFNVLHAHNGRTALVAALALQLAGRGRAVATQHFISPARAHRRGPTAIISKV